ncbi:MAG: hypothetical protein JWN70_1376, partial [Planctomycetaceae bacterium]|nr:hypothetical protein [Planctomycetaceae bacterium]
MSDQWYYQAFGQEFGPLAEEEVARMLLTGELTADDEVREGTDGSWTRAGAVSGLMDLVTAVAVETAEVATDIDTFMLVDEQDAAPVEDQTPDISDFDLSPEVARETKKIEPEEEVEEPEPAIWYFQTFGTVLGPVPLSELGELVDRGELSASDAIRMGTEGDWITAGEIPELFPMGRGTPRPPTYRRPPAEPNTTNSTWQAPVHQPEPAWDAPRSHPMVPAAHAWTAPDASVDVNWYCYVDEQEMGPLAISDLQGLAASGKVTAEVYVKYGVQGEWLLASQVPNLLPSHDPVPASASQVVFVPVAPAAPATLNLADAERSELVVQLLALLKKEGLQTSLLGAINTAAPTSGAGWYCNISGSVMGPVSIEALVQMVLQKRIFPDDLIRLGDTGEWFPAKSVPDLFPDSSGKGKKGDDLDSEMNLMARMDKIYQEAQEAKAKKEAEEAANPSARTGSGGASRSKMADNMLRDINAKMARGKTDAELAAERAAKLEEFYGSFKLDRRAVFVLIPIVIVGIGYLAAPILLANVWAGQGYDALLKILAAVEKDKGADQASFEKKSKDIIKQIDVVAKGVKGGASGSAKRDVARMANYLKEMVRAMAKKPVATAAAGEDEFSRAKKHFEEY